MGRVARGQSPARGVGWRVAKAAVTGVCDAGIGNKKRLQTDLVRGACRVRAFVLGCNTVGFRPGLSLFRVGPPTSFQVCE